MNKKRVVVTGMGAITPIGNTVDEFWKSVKEGKLGFGPITRFDTTDYKCHIAAEVKDFDGKEYMDFKAAKRMELFSQYAVAASKEAMEDAGIDMAKEDPYRVGCAIGSGIGSLQSIEREHTKLTEKGPDHAKRQIQNSRRPCGLRGDDWRGGLRSGDRLLLARAGQQE